MFIEGAFFSQGNISLMASEASLVVQREMLWNALSDGKKTAEVNAWSKASKLPCLSGYEQPKLGDDRVSQARERTIQEARKRGSEGVRESGSEEVRKRGGERVRECAKFHYTIQTIQSNLEINPFPQSHDTRASFVHQAVVQS